MKAEEMLDYLINQLQTLLDGKDIDMNKFHDVCNDTEGRKELKEIIDYEEKI